VGTDDREQPTEKLLQLLNENPVDFDVVEGLRLITAFNKVRDPADRRVLIELAERLSR
jgi:hypothetical protein